MANKNPYIPLEIGIQRLENVSVLLASSAINDNDGSWSWGEDAI